MMRQFILHVDGDSFFASCAQAVYPHLKGKPVVTGSERGVVTAASLEAKKLGISRQTSMYEIKRYFPQCVIVSSNYEMYELFSQKMYTILKKYSPDVEQYSIDEDFACLNSVAPSEYAATQIAQQIKNDIESALDITVSVGLSVNKSLAKLASDFNKPSGFTVVPFENIESFLKEIAVEDIWGIGRATTKLLQNYRIKTAYDFYSKPEKFIQAVLTKPGIEIWKELHGEYIFKLDSAPKTLFQSISKTRTFSPPSSDKNFIFSQLITNLERACHKARLYGLYTNRFSIFLKGQDFSYVYGEVELMGRTASPTVVLKKVRPVFEKLFVNGKEYRATGAILLNLVPYGDEQESILENHVKKEKSRAIFESIDILSKRYGERVVKTGATMFMKKIVHTKRINLPRFEARV
ncbi:MAG: DNA polymerase IV [Microgenomates group bacterium]